MTDHSFKMQIQPKVPPPDSLLNDPKVLKFVNDLFLAYFKDSKSYISRDDFFKAFPYLNSDCEADIVLKLSFNNEPIDLRKIGSVYQLSGNKETAEKKQTNQKCENKECEYLEKNDPDQLFEQTTKQSPVLNEESSQEDRLKRNSNSNIEFSSSKFIPDYLSSTFPHKPEELKTALDSIEIGQSVPLPNRRAQDLYFKEGKLEKPRHRKIKKRAISNNKNFDFQQFENWATTVTEPLKVTPVETNKLLHVEVELFKRRKIDPPRLPRPFPAIRHSARSCLRKFLRFCAIMRQKVSLSTANANALLNVSLYKQEAQKAVNIEYDCPNLLRAIPLPSETLCSRIFEQQTSSQKIYKNEYFGIKEVSGPGVRFPAAKPIEPSLGFFRKVFNSRIFRRQVLHFEEIELAGKIPEKILNSVLKVSRRELDN